MSAVRCSDELMSALALAVERAYARLSLWKQAPQPAQVFAALARENKRSVFARYSRQDSRTHVWGDAPAQFTPATLEGVTPWTLLGWLRFYVYQSCEHEGFYASKLYRQHLTLLTHDLLERCLDTTDIHGNPEPFARELRDRMPWGD